MPSWLDASSSTNPRRPASIGRSDSPLDSSRGDGGWNNLRLGRLRPAVRQEGFPARDFQNQIAWPHSKGSNSAVLLGTMSQRSGGIVEPLLTYRRYGRYNQGWKSTGAIKTAERRLADGTLRHGGQGLMSWAVANARVEPGQCHHHHQEQASGSAKVDPVMAAFDAIANERPRSNLR
jgi:hypothetical protein